nr:immunoglobulin light chain junction region [Macaca mulatta]MOV81517.1 immunoglobulin light chain junction region [Macaca mulatta]
CIQPLDFPWTF